MQITSGMVKELREKTGAGLMDCKAALAEIYPKDVIDEVVGGLESADRWGLAEGQLSLASKIINSQVLNRLVREYVDGERSAQATVELMNQELAKIAATLSGRGRGLAGMQLGLTPAGRF